jgi:predicted nucleotidyltransferase
VTPGEVLGAKRQAILQAASRHGMRDVRVFGSVARGEAGPESDLDLLVAVAPGPSLLDLVAFWQDVEQILGHQVDLISDGGVSPYLTKQIYAEAIPL